MTDAQYLAMQKRALRTARRIQKNLITALNKSDRVMDRLIERKTKIRTESYDLMGTAWENVKKNFSTTEKALADAISAGSW